MTNDEKHIRLTSHPVSGQKNRYPILWGHPDSQTRGPVIASTTQYSDRNVIGTYGGSYMVYRAIAVSSGSLNPLQRPDLTDTAPAIGIGPHSQWFDATKIVSLDPFGHLVAEAYQEQISQGLDIRPTIAITRARLTMPEISEAIAAGRLEPDGRVLRENGEASVIKAAVDPVWFLPGIAKRFGISEDRLRRTLFEQTGGMFPELVTRPDLSVFLPPIGGITVYIFGDVDGLSNPLTKVTCRVHDECNGSDVFGSDICTCRPYLVHAVEASIARAQAGGTGLVIYNRKEGRALGEVTKFLVYNARKRNKDGDTAEAYFERTECVAGVQDARFQELMPDVLHWLGVSKIDQFLSMSNMKYDNLVASGIQIEERVPIPDHLVPADASVEIEAKKAAGYFTPEPPQLKSLKDKKGRDLDAT